MNLTLRRTDFLENGVYGYITDENNKQLFITLEHSYDSGNGDGSYLPKVPTGEYICLKGSHRLSHMKMPFITFELQDVPGHSNILLHQGNYNADSEGCILLGLAKGPDMIVHSRDAFNAFMKIQENTDKFILTVI